MGVSGNSIAGKSFQSFTINEELLKKTVEAIQSGEKEARSSGVMQSFEALCTGFRQNISLGRIYVIPPSIVGKNGQDFPTALLYGCLVRTFGGEEMGDLISHRIGESEFDEYAQTDYDNLKEKLFAVGEDKYAALVLFAPNWVNAREYVAFHFSKDEKELTNLVRHLIFSSYYDPRLSSAFDALMTPVDTSQFDVTNITPKLNYPALSANPLKDFPLLSKLASESKSKILLTRKTADEVLQQDFYPQEVDVFESLDQALRQSLLPDTETVEEAGEKKEDAYKVPTEREIPEVQVRQAAMHTAEEECEKCEGKGCRYCDGKGYTKKGFVFSHDNATVVAAKIGSRIKRSTSIETRVSESRDQKQDVLQAVIDKLNVKFKELASKDPHNYRDQFELSLGTYLLEIAQDMGLEMEFKPEEDTYVLFDQVGKAYKDAPASYEKESSHAPQETPLPTVGPGSTAHDAAPQASDGYVSEKDMPKTPPPAEGQPIGIAVDENGVPRREEEARKAGSDINSSKWGSLGKSASQLTIRKQAATYPTGDEFTDSYIETALWSENDESDPSGGEPLDRNYGYEDLAPETLRKMTEDCRRFQEENAQLLEQVYATGTRDGNPGHAGHDFWLTRNGHGAGFWDSDFADMNGLGDSLTEASHAFGEDSLYVGDDNLIHSYYEGRSKASSKQASVQPNASYIAALLAGGAHREAYEARSQKSKSAAQKREEELQRKYGSQRQKLGVALTEEDIFSESMEDMGPAPEIKLPGESNSTHTEADAPAEMKSNQPEETKGGAEAGAEKEEKALENSASKSDWAKNRGQAQEEPKEASAKQADTADNPANEKDGEGAMVPKTNKEKAVTAAPAGKRFRCDQCEAAMINGVFCHETGCPNTNSRYDADSGTWIKQRKCIECGNRVDADDPCCSAPFEDDDFVEEYDEDEDFDHEASVDGLDGLLASSETKTASFGVDEDFWADVLPSGKIARAKQADEVQPDVAEAKAEVVNPDSVDADIQQPTESVAEAAHKTAEAIDGDLAQARKAVDADKQDLTADSASTDTVNPAHFASEERHDEVPVAQGESDGDKQPQSDLSGGAPEAHEVPPQADTKVAAPGNRVVVYDACPTGYTVRILEGNETIDEYNGGNNPQDSMAQLPPSDPHAVPYEKLLQHAHQTALEMAQENGIAPEAVEHNGDLLAEERELEQHHSEPKEAAFGDEQAEEQAFDFGLGDLADIAVRSEASKTAMRQLVAPPDNQYFKVLKPFQVNLKGESYATNEWYGASQLYRARRIPTMVEAGDELHCLVGGSFLIRKGQVIGEILSSDPEKGAFEKSYGDSRARFEIPNDAVEPIDQAQTSFKQHNYRGAMRSAAKMCKKCKKNPVSPGTSSTLCKACHEESLAAAEKAQGVE